MKNLLNFIDWKEQDALLSIGCGAAWWEINLMLQKPCQSLILIDPNEIVLNGEDLQEGIQYFENQYQKSLITEIQFFNIDAKNSGLPSVQLDGILLFNSFHEIENPDQLLHECYRILKPGGFIMVEEELSHTSRKIHEGCEKPLFFEKELIQLFFENGFHSVSSLEKDELAAYFRFVK
jgi:ubiquinone/menaquinone biosynthesis C-methylase UbiE